MFEYCGFYNIDVNYFNTTNVESTAYLFSNCMNLEHLNNILYNKIIID